MCSRVAWTMQQQLTKTQSVDCSDDLAACDGSRALPLPHIEGSYCWTIKLKVTE